MKKNLITVILIISIFVFSTMVVYAADEAILLALPGLEMQEKSNWCWVASARNSVHNETDNHRTQKEAVRHIKGTLLNWYPNDTGTISETEEAAEYISKGTEEYSVVNGAVTFQFLKSEVDNHNATIVGYSFYNGTERIGGHMVVITGYCVIGNNNQVVYYDPGDGISHTCSYSAFCNGSYNGGIYNATCYNTET